LVADWNPLRVLQLGAGQETDFHALLQRRRYAAQHLQVVAIVLRIFEPTAPADGGVAFLSIRFPVVRDG
jgi:hypothetical protein